MLGAYLAIMAAVMWIALATYHENAPTMIYRLAWLPLWLLSYGIFWCIGVMMFAGQRVYIDFDASPAQ